MQPGVVVFIAGAMDEEWTTDEKKFEKIVTEKLAQYFKCAEMPNPIHVMTQIWNK